MTPIRVPKLDEFEQRLGGIEARVARLDYWAGRYADAWVAAHSCERREPGDPECFAAHAYRFARRMVLERSAAIAAMAQSEQSPEVRP